MRRLRQDHCSQRHSALDLAGVCRFRTPTRIVQNNGDSGSNDFDIRDGKTTHVLNLLWIQSRIAKQLIVRDNTATLLRLEVKEAKR